MTTDPDTDYFRIDANGEIRAARDLNSLCRNSITFFVTCKDSFNDVVGPTTIQASLEGANDQPSITGINYNKDVPEDSPVGTVLGTFSVDDDDDTTCRIATNPPDSLQYYNLDFAERSIVVRSALNYEQTQTRVTNVTVICSDGLCSSSPGYLYVRVTDVNEPIDINPKDFTLSSYEGRIDIDPKWTPIDEDFNDDPTYTIINGNTKGLFVINPTTGKITSTIDYDVDGGIHPITETIEVQVSECRSRLNLCFNR
ncbi:protocadherin-9-like [Littorina saxatilis]|uniref:protocadherin-9-like n=1 Tax=Littorina saxatilis TaxID=31220 RepID=UPI0038B5E2DB